MSENQQSSETARKSHDAYGLGSTPGQRGAEILAGLRAEHHPSPETKALAKFTGGMVARLFKRFMSDTAILNYTLSRPMLVDGVISRLLPEDTSNTVFVDIASGFSPRGFRMANKYPSLDVIEVDLPDVIEEKQKRLNRARNLEIPANMRFMAGDLAVTPLAGVMNGQKADIISAEGLLTYLTYDQLQMFCKTVYECLNPGGVFVIDLPLHDGIEEAKEVTRLFSQQAGNFYSIAKDVEEGRQYLLDAGYDPVESYLPTACVESFDLMSPMLDIGFVMAAYKPKTASPTSNI